MENNGQELLNWKKLIQKAIKPKAITWLYFLSMLWEIDQRIACNKRPAKNTKACFSYQKTPIKNQIVKEPKTKALTSGFFFQDLKVKKFPKTWNLEDEFSYYFDPFMQSEKVGKIFIKKAQKERKN